MSSGIRDVGILSITRVLVILIGVGTQACLMRLLGDEGRGAFAVCIMFTTVLSVLFVIGGANSSIYHVASGRQGLSEGLVNTWVYILAGSLAGMAAGFVLFRGDICPQLRPQWLLNIFTKADARDFYLAMLLIPVSSLAGTLLPLLTSLGDFLWFGIVTAAQCAVQLALYLATMWLWPLGVSGALLSVIATNLLVIVATMMIFRHKHKATFVRPSLRQLKEMLGYGGRYYLALIDSQAGLQIGTLLLAMLAPKNQIGYFAVASMLANQAMLVPETLTTALVPRVAKSNVGRKDLIGLCARFSGLVCGAMLLLMAVLAKPVILLMQGHQNFLPAVGLLQILAVGVAVRCATKPFASYLTLTDRPGFASAAVFVGMVLNVGLILVLVPAIGVAGAAWSATLGYIVGSVILYWGFGRFSGSSFRQTWQPHWSDLTPFKTIWQKLRSDE